MPIPGSAEPGMGTLGPYLVRAVTHHDVDTAGVRRAVDAIAAALKYWTYGQPPA